MQWYEIKLELPLILLLEIYDFLWLYTNGISIKRKRNKFLLKAYLFCSSPRDLLEKLNNFLKPLINQYKSPHPTLLVTPLNSFPADDFLLVPFPTSAIPEFGLPILLQRGNAFGNGRHPSTIYSLWALKSIFNKESKTFDKKKILDAGTGTGILAIGAAKLGGENITAVEIDPIAFKEAKENIKLNGLTDKIKILYRSITEIKGKFNVILANLYGAILRHIAPILVNLLTQNGWLVLGGITVFENKEIIPIYTQLGLIKWKHFCDEEWSVVILRRK